MADEKGNTGSWNTGDMNTGDMNTGNRNTGNRNTGDMNTGSWNTGDMNTGDMNTGDMNTGSWNTGDMNTGDMNTGNRNTGNRNTGDMNTGSWNTGYMNTGSWNTGNRNTGYMNTDTPKVRLFNKETNVSRGDIVFPDFFYITLTEWIYAFEMTDEEKAGHPLYETTNGYLKSYDYKEAWGNSWADATDEDKAKLYKLPNFDAEIFKEITGIDVAGKESTIDVAGRTFKVSDIEKALSGLTPVK